MACSSMNISNYSSIRRSSSMEDLCKQATMRKSFSDNNLLCSSGRVCARSSSTKLKPSRSFGIFPLRFSGSALLGPIKSLLFETEPGNETKLDDGVVIGEELEGQKVKRAGWIQRLLELRMQWKGKREVEECVEKDDGDDDYDDDDDGDDGGGGGEDDDGCLVEYGAEEEVDERRVGFDPESFSKLLVQVPWSDAKKFSKLSFLCNKAYKIPEIKANDVQLRRYYGLHFVTSSLEKKAEVAALKAKLNNQFKNSEGSANLESHSRIQTVRSSVAYEIAASAASHVQCRARSECGDGNLSSTECKSEKAAQMAASTMTTVVAAREKEKQEAAEELQSLHSSPCEWFICDDPCEHVRYFVTQGSESLASWQTNLFFEPVNFEGTDALVHRGIYEAAKGIYEQFLPEIQNHIKAHGDKAKFQFTGHSLGGSLSQLVQMMLIARKAINPSMLLPVVTFGSPFVFCGGHKVLERLGVDENQLHCVIMHRDIVPRAFSCSYPRQVAQVLKRLNGSFRSHPCLNAHKMLYSPLGKMYILQPTEKQSPPHPWLPSGCSLYALDNTRPSTSAMALRAFLNTPHPLETLSDPKAYGSEGTILRDHDSSNYSKAINGVMRQYTKTALREVRKERHLIWPLIASPAQRAWTHEGNLENRTARKEIMTSV